MTDADAYIGERLSEARKAAGLSQADFAAEMTRQGFPMQQQTVLKIEKGARPLRLAEAVVASKILDLDLEAFRQESHIERRLGELQSAYERLSQELSNYLVRRRVVVAPLGALESPAKELSPFARQVVSVNFLDVLDGEPRSIANLYAWVSKDVDRKVYTVTLEDTEAEQGEIDERAATALGHIYEAGAEGSHGQHPEA